MADEQKKETSPTTLLDQLVSLDPHQRRKITATLRSVAETVAEVPDGRQTAHTLGLLAHFLDQS